MRTEQTSERRQTAWSDIDWTATEAIVRRLQDRIYRAAAAGNGRQVKNLQKLLVRSLSAKRLAVRRVAQQNAGRNTPGVDGVVCRPPFAVRLRNIHASDRLGPVSLRLRPSVNLVRLSGVLHTTPSTPGVVRPAFCWVTLRTASRFADVERTRSFCRFFTCRPFPAAAAR